MATLRQIVAAPIGARAGAEPPVGAMKLRAKKPAAPPRKPMLLMSLRVAVGESPARDSSLSATKPEEEPHTKSAAYGTTDATASVAVGVSGHADLKNLSTQDRPM